MSYLKTIKGTLLIGLAACLGAMGYLKLTRWLDEYMQRKKHKDVQKRLRSINTKEEDLVLGTLDETTPINRIQVIGTHNSSHSMPDRLRSFLVGLKDKKIAKELRYDHIDILDQLGLGVRNFEMDIRIHKGRVVNNHVPLVDDRSHCPDFKIALKEIKAWSDMHPDHVSISILLELKGDYEHFDSSLERFDKKGLQLTSDTIEQILGKDKMITPDMLRVQGKTLKQSVATVGWPTYKEAKGKILIMMMDNGEFTPLYMEMYPDLKGALLFADIPEEQEGAVFLRCDNPFDTERMERLVERNVYVRTMAYTANNKDLKQLNAALDSKATIISTDYPKGHEDQDGRSVSFQENKMLRMLSQRS